MSHRHGRDDVGLRTGVVRCILQLCPMAGIRTVLRRSGTRSQRAARQHLGKEGGMGMKRKLIRMLASIGAVAVACAGYGALGEAEAARRGCRDIAPFCANECSCGPARCAADCDDECHDWIEEGDGELTVWCEDMT